MGTEGRGVTEEALKGVQGRDLWGVDLVKNPSVFPAEMGSAGMLEAEVDHPCGSHLWYRME